MIPQKVIICGVVKNVENSIERNIQYALGTGSNFEEFKLVIYENNSTDNTKDILNKYATNTNIKIICKNIEGYDKKENNKLFLALQICSILHG